MQAHLGGLRVQTPRNKCITLMNPKKYINATKFNGTPTFSGQTTGKMVKVQVKKIKH